MVKGDIYNQFFNVVKVIYLLNNPGNYIHTTPVYESWSGISKDDEIVPLLTDLKNGLQKLQH